MMLAIYDSGKRNPIHSARTLTLARHYKPVATPPMARSPTTIAAVRVFVCFFSDAQGCHESRHPIAFLPLSIRVRTVRKARECSRSSRRGRTWAPRRITLCSRRGGRSGR